MHGRSVGLDFVRSIAIASVVLFHVSDFFRFGYLGVDLFFLLSGFLMSRYVSGGHLDNPKSALRYFFRRGFIIWPAYFVFIGFVLGLQMLGTIELNNSISIPSLLFYYYNYTSGFDSFVGHLWSLCIEEHFYLTLPFLTVFGSSIFGVKGRRPYFIFLLILFIFISFAVGSFDNPFTTHFRIFELYMGVVIGLLPSEWSKSAFMRIGVFPVCFVLMVIIILPVIDPLNYTLRMYLTAGISSLFVYSSCNVKLIGVSFFKNMSNISYSLYLYHVPILILVENVYIGVVLAIGAAWVSRVYVEKPFLQWRDARYVVGK